MPDIVCQDTNVSYFEINGKKLNNKDCEIRPQFHLRQDQGVALNVSKNNFQIYMQKDSADSFPGFFSLPLQTPKYL